jgi:PASTA domain
MSEIEAAPNRAAPGSRSPRRGPPAAQLVAGDYLGQQASVAAQAIRRMDLRPGLERSFDDDAVIGVVLGQDPAPGESVARGGMVTLYVAAPSAGAAGKPPGPPDGQQITASVVIPAAAPLGAASSEATAPRRRSRKPGLARSAAQEPDRVPAPQPLLRREEDPDEALLAHTNDVFSGRTTEMPAWHRAYSRRIEWRLGLGAPRRFLMSAAIVLAVVASAVLIERLAVEPACWPRPRVNRAPPKA